jgi:hypothetical protein
MFNYNQFKIRILDEKVKEIYIVELAQYKIRRIQIGLYTKYVTIRPVYKVRYNLASRNTNSLN